MKIRQTTLALSIGIATTCAMGCGYHDPVLGPVDGNNDSSMNAETNNDPTNGDANNDPRNAETNNDPTNASTNNDDPMGSATFMLPTEETAYTNGMLTVSVALDGDATDAELVLDEEEVLGAFIDSMSYEWDTTGYDEGRYELAVRYALDGAMRWSFEQRTVIVDRTSPELQRTLPEADSTGNRPNTPISLFFDEPLDPESVNASTVMLDFDGGSTTNHSVSLSADGTTIGVDFDRDAVAAPYTGTVSVAGVTDRAGNSVRHKFDFLVPAWRAETLPGLIGDITYAEIDGAEYVFGIAQGNTDDMLKIFKKQGAWQEILAEPLNQVYDVAIDVIDGKAQIAVLHRGAANNLIVKKAQLLEFDSADDSLTWGGEQVVGVDSPGGAIAIDARAAALGSVDAIATVSGGRLRVFQTVNRLLSFQTQNIFPTLDYDYVRDEDLDVHVKADGAPEVIFTRCSSDTDPCFRTYGERLSKTNSGWEEIGSMATPYSADAGDCDEFTNFEALWDGDLPTILFAYHGPCSSAESRVRALEGDASGWNSLGSGILAGMPGLTPLRYSTHLAFGANGETLGLMASPTHLMIAAFGRNGPVWMAEVAPELDTQGVLGKFREQALFVDSAGSPVVVFRHRGAVKIYRRN